MGERFIPESVLKAAKGVKETLFRKNGPDTESAKTIATMKREHDIADSDELKAARGAALTENGLAGASIRKENKEWDEMAEEAIKEQKKAA